MSIIKKYTALNFLGIKVKFAFVPLRTYDHEIIWLEKYFVYDDTRCFWRGRYNKYKNIENFWNKCVRQGRN